MSGHMNNDSQPSIVFAVQGSYEYHNGRMAEYRPSGMSFVSKMPVTAGTPLVVKLSSYCAIFEGVAVSCASAGRCSDAPLYCIDVAFE